MKLVFWKGKCAIWTKGSERLGSGSDLEASDFLTTAKEIVKECKGLLVSFVTVGKALKDQNIHVWIHSLSQLRRPIPIDFPGFIKEVYNSL